MSQLAEIELENAAEHFAAVQGALRAGISLGENAESISLLNLKTAARDWVLTQDPAILLPAEPLTTTATS